MTGKAGKRQRKPQRKCIFCGQGGTPGNQMSEEHLWSDWMHHLLPQIPGMRTVHGSRYFRMEGMSEEAKERQGSAFTRRFRLVCQNCNSGWMSGVEGDAKPILIRLLQGQKTVLLKNDRTRLATWITLKTMVADAINPSDP